MKISKDMKLHNLNYNSKNPKIPEKTQFLEKDDIKKCENQLELNILLNPIQSAKILLFLTKNAILLLLQYIKNYILLIFALTLIIILPLYIQGPHIQVNNYSLYIFAKYFEFWYSVLKWGVYWIVLGIASSIGLGSGLHTFVLYLGPHIAQVTLVANECKTIPRMLPSRWNFEIFDKCPIVQTEITFAQILLHVQLEAILWGFGTALGELPPYFIAKAAETLAHKIKEFIYANLKHYAFLTVVLCASIPNPFFDLAGITCGHFLIPFSLFFGATVLGKAVIKVHLQTIFVIFVFRKSYVEQFLSYMETGLPVSKNFFTKLLANQKALLHSPFLQNKKSSILSQIWEILITIMIIYFIYSMLNSLVNCYNKKNKEANPSNSTNSNL